MAPQARVYMKRARIDRLADLHLCDMGVLPGGVETDRYTAGVVSPHQGAAHRQLLFQPLALLIPQPAFAQA